MAVLTAVIELLLTLSASSFVIDRHRCHLRTLTAKEWSIADDWDDLSAENPLNSAPDSSDIFNRDLAQIAAWKMDDYQGAMRDLSEEEIWLKSTIDAIVGEETIGGATDLDQTSFEDDMGTEISLLVRCNDSPEQLLISQGRALPPLTDAERDDVSQLIQVSKHGSLEATPFLKESVKVMFGQHATAGNMGPSRVAAWLKKSLGADESGAIGPHDWRVTTVISRFGDYAAGYLTLPDFQDLYFDAVVGDKFNLSSIKHLAQYRAKEIANVWRDLRNHGIVSPVEFERALLVQELEGQAHLDLSMGDSSSLVMDECEILEEGGHVAGTRKSHKAKSSHELVELAYDNETPLYMKDGEFVFIDENSCIGCTQCVLASPSTFHMTEYDGRARAFSQRNTPDVAAAVSACPVDCMHYVSFRELKTLETARDQGDGRKDHRHFGESPDRGWIALTPLHVAGRDSDANHRSSWYHFLRNKCQSSKECPQRGCYDCPVYSSNPQSNPYFQEREKKATHIRAKHFMDSGVANSFRKVADL